MLAIRRQGSLGRAAKSLGMSKSTVSRRVAAIEDELGVELLQRAPSGYELTEAGLTASEVAERMERLVDELVSAVGDADRIAAGSVHVTVPPWFAQHVIIPALPGLREAHPGLELHLITSHEVLNLARREADIGLRNVRPTQHSLHVRKAGEIAFAMYASREYLARHGVPHSRASFAGHSLVAHHDVVARVESFRWANELPCPVAFRATDAVSMMDAVAADLGIGVLPCFLAQRREELTCLEPLGAPKREVIWLVSRPDAREIRRVQIVSTWLVELFQQNEALLAGAGGGA